MGADKALLEVGGVPLWKRQRDVLAAAGAADVMLSARPEHEWSYRAEGFSALLHDAFPDCGPIMGVTAGLERAAHGHVAVLAIDLPEMSPEWFTRLLSQCEPNIGAVGRRGNFFEPLAAIYPTAMKWLAWDTIAADTYSLQALLAAAEKQSLVRVHEIADDEARWFKNWNQASGDAKESGAEPGGMQSGAGSLV
jgi:molybdopterin-guanine dinucleotide biosynthesis protein A